MNHCCEFMHHGKIIVDSNVNYSGICFNEEGMSVMGEVYMGMI